MRCKLLALTIALCALLSSSPAAMAWERPADLNDYISLKDYGAYLVTGAMDGNGNAITLWIQKTDEERAMLYKSERRNNVWRHPSSVGDRLSFTGSEVYAFQAAMSDNGSAVIVWAQNGRLYLGHYRNGAWAWPADTSQAINPSGSDAEAPSVAMDGNGNAIIAWEQRDGSDNLRIYCSEFRNGVWHHPTNLDDFFSPASIMAAQPKVAMSDNGQACISWLQADNDENEQIGLAQYTGDTWVKPSGPDDFISLPGYLAHHHAIAMNSLGDVLVTWIQFTDLGLMVYIAQRQSGVWTYPKNTADALSPDGSLALCVFPALDDHGLALVAWHTMSGDGFRAYLAEKRDGKWSKPATLDDYMSDPGVDTQVISLAIDNYGGGLILWLRVPEEGIALLQKVEYRNGLGWDIPHGETAFSFPETDADGSGFALMSDSLQSLIFWSQSEGSCEAVYMAEFTGAMLRTSKLGNGDGTVSSTPIGLQCGDVCEPVFEKGTKLTLSATADTESRFVGWRGPLCWGMGECEITLDENKEIGADFAPAVSVDIPWLLAIFSISLLFLGLRKKKQ